ncbi:MAG: diaminobutyrate--2-oxoglutarate transaminase [Proteobacteria bacterium]|nr:diaminobutyrate--2-oxoglutarate transaminase [Pseudomonadota bacterium]
MKKTNVEVFLNYESEVRTYCRTFSAVFAKAKDSHLYSETGQEYIDFLCGAGALNYGHNNNIIMNAVIEYMKANGVMLTLDLHSKAKKEFITTFVTNVLEPRDLPYKFQFTSPTGTSVVESAVKLARKFTGRQNVIAFTNAFHGMSATSLSLTGSKSHRQSTLNASNVTRFPFEGYMGDEINTIELYRKLFEDKTSGVDLPAAVILETIQGEGGINVASNRWLRELRTLTEEFDILLIVDDIQAGCGRTGTFFSFEPAGIQPDIVCLSKSIGGIGLPFAMLLLRPELDIWSPGEDNGTFRGNNLAFVAATSMLKHYWNSFEFEHEIRAKERMVLEFFDEIEGKYSEHIKAIRGRGLMHGIEFYSAKHARDIVKACFENHLLIEVCGPEDQVLKFMPALTIPPGVLRQGLYRVGKAMHATLSPKWDTALAG